MNRKDLYDYLNNKIWIENRIEELSARKQTINKLTSTYGLNVGGGSSEIQDKVAEDLVKILDETTEYEKIVLDLKQKQNDITAKLAEMKNIFYRNILYMKYIRGLTLNDIASSYNKSIKYIINLHGYALLEFDKICEKK